MIKNFDKTTARALGVEIEAALKAIGDKHGISIQYNGGQLAGTEFVMKLKCKTTDTSAIEAKRKSDWDASCAIFGLTPDDYMKEVLVDRRANKIVKLIGFTNRAKFCVRALDETGKEVLYNDVVLRLAGAKDPLATVTPTIGDVIKR
jgi:hypothetical protein